MIRLAIWLALLSAEALAADPPAGSPAGPAPGPSGALPAPAGLPPIPAPPGTAQAGAQGPTPGTVAAPRALVVVDRVAASVNDEVITLSEIYDFGGDYIEAQAKTGGQDAAAARRRAEREVLDRLIERILVEQEIAALQLTVTEQELDRTIDDIARRNGLDRAGLRREIERSGMSWDSYRTQLQGDLQQMKFAQAILRPRVNITEDEVRDAYNRLGQTAPQLVRLQAIFLAFPADPAQREATLARAQALQTQAAGMTTEQFAALSRERDEAGFGAQGGEMGRFGKGELLPALDSAVHGLSAGAISAPVVLDQGVFILRVVGFEAATQDLDAVREQLMEQLFEARMTEEQARWLEQARARASIRVLLP